MVNFAKHLKKGLVALLCSSAVGSYLILKDNENKEEKYAVLIYANDETNTQYHKNIDPIDADLETVGLSEIYKTLKENGFEDQNIKILYSKNPFVPNFNEEKNHDVLQEIKKKHFNGSYSNDVTEKNIIDALKELKVKIDYNDKFIFYLSCHGAPTGTQGLGNFGRDDTLTADEISIVFWMALIQNQICFCS